MSIPGRALPPRMHLKDGRYYYVKRPAKGVNPVWTGLSRNEAEAMQQYLLLEAGKTREAFEKFDAPAYWLGEVAKTLWDQTRARARDCDILFLLTVDDVVAMGVASGWRCSVSGVRFTRDKPGSATRRPFMPSIDRIQVSQGYTKDNCRLVCWAANLAMSDWGEGVLAQLALAYVKHRGLLSPLEASNARAASREQSDE